MEFYWHFDVKRLWWVGKKCCIYVHIKNRLCLISPLYHLSDRPLEPKFRWPPWINRRKLNVSSLSNLHSPSHNLCVFHILLMKAVAGRLSSRVNTVMAGFHKCWRWFVMPPSKTEWEQTWMTHWHYSSRFLLYLWELVVFSSVSPRPSDSWMD